MMDDAEVTEDDLGAGLLFRENDGDVGKKVRDDGTPRQSCYYLRGFPAAANVSFVRPLSHSVFYFNLV